MGSVQRVNRWVVGGLTVVGLVFGCASVGVFSVVRRETGRLAAIEESGKAFLAALGSRDGDGACDHMTVLAQAEFAAKFSADNCSEAVEVLTGRLSEVERLRLAGSYESRSFGSGGHGHVNVGDNALQISRLVLSEVDGRWLVTQML
ncbi:hypothetical protein [Micromonospora viridifaciens]|uniref:hypothetical protein n=1 Tax=Micromonospora viridifaciens TaxID=1881 RepID=UPI00142E60F0|nr:hypothetical protein [Micromonospora viridifaciens]